MMDSYQPPWVTYLEIEGDEYVTHGNVDDEIIMFRKPENLLECERDYFQALEPVNE